VLIGMLLTSLGLFSIGKLVGVVQDATAVRKLPTEERLQLVRHAMTELESICLEPAAASGSVQEHCAAQAAFVRQLPECTESCQRAAAIVLPHARR
jgi:hypothetical protein